LSATGASTKVTIVQIFRFRTYTYITVLKTPNVKEECRSQT